MDFNVNKQFFTVSWTTDIIVLLEKVIFLFFLVIYS